MPDTAAFTKWLFSWQSKHLLLEALLSSPDRSWSRKQLAVASGQHAKARIDLHLNPLIAAGILRRTGDSYRLVADHPLVERLRALLAELDLPTGG